MVITALMKNLQKLFACSLWSNEPHSQKILHWKYNTAHCNADITNHSVLGSDRKRYCLPKGKSKLAFNVPFKGARGVHVIRQRRLHLEMIGVVDTTQRHGERHVLQHVRHPRRLHRALEVIHVSRPHLHRHRCSVDVLRMMLVDDRPICLQLSRRSAINAVRKCRENHMCVYSAECSTVKSVFECLSLKGYDKQRRDRQRRSRARRGLDVGYTMPQPVLRRRCCRVRDTSQSRTTTTTTLQRQQRRDGRSSATGRRLAASRSVAVHHVGAGAAASPGLSRRLLLLLLLLLARRQALFTAALASRLKASTDAHARYLYPAGYHSRRRRHQCHVGQTVSL